jgi:hypothetical protein
MLVDQRNPDRRVVGDSDNSNGRVSAQLFEVLAQGRIGGKYRDRNHGPSAHLTSAAAIVRRI